MSFVLRIRDRSIVFLSLLALGASARAQGIWGSIGEHKLTASDAGAAAFLGEAIDVSGDRAIVSRLDALYVYELQAGSWVEVAKLLPVGGTPNNQFAHAAAISGDVIVAGAWLDDGAANDHGAAFVYERDAAGTWNFVTKLTASDAGVADHFGWSIDVDGDSILVGSDEDDLSGFNDGGSAYVFRRVGGAWLEEAKLVANDPGVGDFFAWSVSIRGDMAACGSLNDDEGASNTGSAYVFRRTGTAWAQESKLVSNDIASNDDFGFDVAVEGDLAVVGAYGDDDLGSNSGSAYVFANSGGVWSQQAKLLADGGAAGQTFGRSVAIDGELVAVGAHQTTVSGDANQGALHLFQRGPSAWSHVLTITASDGDPNDYLGRSIALDSGRFAATAHGDDDGGTSSGAGYLFDVVELFANYCSSTPNSTGAPAVMGFTGSSSISLNDLQLIASPVPDRPGLFVYGATQVEVPFGNGEQCVGAPFFLLDVHHATGNTLTHALDVNNPPDVAGQILVGSRWNFQAWFRDPAAGGAYFDLSDGLSVYFLP
jgi:hypothetical protein